MTVVIRHIYTHTHTDKLNAPGYYKDAIHFEMSVPTIVSFGFVTIL